ncbi:uncharacterized protein LOC119431924 [Dermacentor silvarum]|uniref:uncharacterized protein LOC119431924 n=1 Tax=Dermacentor silvarum TaxID=543639 RepID=UPI00210104CF|nr:uncharacterized protein LOC119431924 [Dermacentor silvarum]
MSMPVFYNDKEVKSCLIVLNCSGLSLCGRDLIAKFSDAGSSVLNVSVQQGPGPGSSRTPATDAVLSEFQDVFSTELGLIDGHPVHLKLKEGATPKFSVYHPQSNGLAERAVRTIKDGLKKIGEGRLDDKLNRLLFNYRRTPNHSVKSPSELFFGYHIRSRLDTCFRPVHAGPANEPDDWQLSSPEAAVYARNFGTGEKWTPGIVQSKMGSRMVAIRTPAGSVRRHVDQVRKRENSTPPLGTDQEAANQASRTGTPSDYPQSPRPSAEQGEFAASNAATVEPDSPPQALRRSTRQRKPVQRLQY